MFEHFLLQVASGINIFHDAWELTTQNKLSEAFFPPPLLRQFLLSLAPILPTGTSLMYPVTDNTLPLYYRAIETFTGAVTSNSFRLFSIIPLSSQKQTFSVFRPIALPRKPENDSIVTVHILFDFPTNRIAISQNELSFLELPDDYNQTCLETDEILCPIVSPIQTHNSFSCLYAIYRNNSADVTQFCKFRFISHTFPTFIHVPMTYDWFYHSLEPIDVHIDCGGSPPTTTKTLVGSGFLKIDGGCSGYGPNIEFPAITQTTSNLTVPIQINSYFPVNSSFNTFNFSEIILPNDMFDHQKAKIILASVMGKSTRTQSLSWDTYQTLAKMQQTYFETEYNTISATDVTAYATQFIVLLVMLFAIGYVIYVKFIRPFARPRPPQRTVRDNPARVSSRTPPPAYENHELCTITTEQTDQNV